MDFRFGWCSTTTAYNTMMMRNGCGFDLLRTRVWCFNDRWWSILQLENISPAPFWVTWARPGGISSLPSCLFCFAKTFAWITSWSTTAQLLRRRRRRDRRRRGWNTTDRANLYYLPVEFVLWRIHAFALLRNVYAQRSLFYNVSECVCVFAVGTRWLDLPRSTELGRVRRSPSPSPSPPPPPSTTQQCTIERYYKLLCVCVYNEHAYNAKERELFGHLFANDKRGYFNTKASAPAPFQSGHWRTGARSRCGLDRYAIGGRAEKFFN